MELPIMVSHGNHMMSGILISEMTLPGLRGIVVYDFHTFFNCDVYHAMRGHWT